MQVFIGCSLSLSLVFKEVFVTSGPEYSTQCVLKSRNYILCDSMLFDELGFESRKVDKSPQKSTQKV